MIQFKVKRLVLEDRSEVFDIYHAPYTMQDLIVCACNEKRANEVCDALNDLVAYATGEHESSKHIAR